MKNRHTGPSFPVSPLTPNFGDAYGFFLEQIRLVNPKIIILTGASAIEGLFQEKSVGITKIRGQWRDWEGRACMPIFHPSYLLRNQARDQGSPKWLTWQDMQAVRQKYDELKAEEEF